MRYPIFLVKLDISCGFWLPGTRSSRLRIDSKVEASHVCVQLVPAHSYILVGENGSWKPTAVHSTVDFANSGCFVIGAVFNHCPIPSTVPFLFS